MQGIVAQPVRGLKIKEAGDGLGSGLVGLL